jgi:hypothetical protein
MGNGGENRKSGKKAGTRAPRRLENPSISELNAASARACPSSRARTGQEESIPRNGSRSEIGDAARSIAGDDEGGSDELTE